MRGEIAAVSLTIFGKAGERQRRQAGAMDARTPPWPRSRRALLVAAAVAALLALLAPAGTMPLIVPPHADA